MGYPNSTRLIGNKFIGSRLICFNHSNISLSNELSLSQQGVVLASQQFESKHHSELKVVQTMLETLNLEGVVFTMDALHCQKNY